MTKIMQKESNEVTEFVATAATTTAATMTTTVDLQALYPATLPEAPEAMDMASFPESVVASTVASTMASTMVSTVASTLAEGVIDSNLAQVAMSAVESGTLTPLIKEELRCTIQNKRLQQGQDELQVEFTSREPEELTPEEEERRRRRRERNKVAAQRCRSKRKVLADELEKESHELESQNTKLKDQVSTLEEEKRELERMLMSHDLFASSRNSSCSMRLSTSTVSDDDLDLLGMDDADEDQVVGT